jgi:hypothetical protein
MADFWAFNIAGYFLPFILRAKGVDTGTQTVDETYRSYVWIYLPGITATFVAAAVSLRLLLLYYSLLKLSDHGDPSVRP